MNLLELLTSFEPHPALAVILGLSIAIYTLGANLAWVARRHWTMRSGRLGRVTLRLSTSRVARVIGEITRWLYYLAFPWATLMLGYTTTRALGIWRMDWLAGIVPVALLALGAGAVMVWVWRPYARTVHPHAIDETGWNWARQIVEAFYQQAHWAFYRSAPILWLGDGYWGTVFGLGLILIEGWSNPSVRAHVEEITRADAPLWSAGLAIVSALVFILTQNTWYCLIVHLILVLVLRGAIGFPRAHPSSEN